MAISQKSSSLGDFLPGKQVLTRIERSTNIMTRPAGAVACEAIKRAIEELGWESLGGRAVKGALDSNKDFDPYGTGPIA